MSACWTPVCRARGASRAPWQPGSPCGPDTERRSCCGALCLATPFTLAGRRSDERPARRPEVTRPGRRPVSLQGSAWLVRPVLTLGPRWCAACARRGSAARFSGHARICRQRSRPHAGARRSFPLNVCRLLERQRLGERPFDKCNDYVAPLTQLSHRYASARQKMADFHHASCAFLNCDAKPAGMR